MRRRRRSRARRHRGAPSVLQVVVAAGVDGEIRAEQTPCSPRTAFRRAARIGSWPLLGACIDDALEVIRQVTTLLPHRPRPVWARGGSFPATSGP